MEKRPEARSEEDYRRRTDAKVVRATRSREDDFKVEDGPPPFGQRGA